MASFKFNLDNYKPLITKLLKEKFKDNKTNAEINATIESFLNELENNKLENCSNSEESITVYPAFSDADIIHSITIFIYKIQELYSSNVESFYDYEKSYTELIDIHKNILEIQPKHSHYETAYNICLNNFKTNNIYFNTCMFTLERIINWEYAANNEEYILSNILNNFIIYWNNVLKTYIKPSARIKRIHYLIDSLTTLKQKPFILAFPSFIQKIDTQLNEYTRLTIEPYAQHAHPRENI